MTAPPLNLASPPPPVPEPRRAHALPWSAIWILLLSLSAVLSALFTVAAHAQRGFFLPVLATATCLLAALFDAWTRRIPNPITYTAILLGLGLNALGTLLAHTHALAPLVFLAAPGLSQSLLGFGACVLIAMLGLLARVGGGDLKLLVALGAMIGLSSIGDVLIFALSVAVIYAILNLLVFNRLNTILCLFALRLLELVYFRKFDLAFTDAHHDDDHPLRHKIPMAVPLAIGLIIAQCVNLKAALGVH